MNHSPKHKACSVDGCTSPTHGKQFCHTHAKLKGQSLAIPAEQRARMLSNCCDALCIDGTRHDYGKQYCKKCEQPCCWHLATAR